MPEEPNVVQVVPKKSVAPLLESLVHCTSVAPKIIQATLAKQKIKMMAIRRLSMRSLAERRRLTLQCKAKYSVPQNSRRRKDYGAQDLLCSLR